MSVPILNLLRAKRRAFPQQNTGTWRGRRVFLVGRERRVAGQTVHPGACERFLDFWKSRAGVGHYNAGRSILT